MSTIPPSGPLISIRAEDGAQTRDPQLGRLMLYRLSYFRDLNACFYKSEEWAVMDSNHRRRKPAELQSAPFGHSGNCPLFFCDCKGRNKIQLYNSSLGNFFCHLFTNRKNIIHGAKRCGSRIFSFWFGKVTCTEKS